VNIHSCHAVSDRVISYSITEYVVQYTIDTIDYALADTLDSRGRQPKQNSSHQFAHFASNVIRRAEVTVSTLLVSLVYLHRAKYHICIESADWAHERIFLGSLIVASKVSRLFGISNYLSSCFVLVYK
jgi:hypothetical protein